MSKARKKIQSSRGVLKFNCNAEFGSESDKPMLQKNASMSLCIVMQESVPHFNKGTPHLPLPEKKLRGRGSGRGARARWRRAGEQRASVGRGWREYFKWDRFQ